MCLFPFEPACYQQYSVAADYTGHPMADVIPLEVSTSKARAELNIETDAIFVALLPGSRMSEVEKLSTSMLDAARILSKRNPDIYFLMPAATQGIAQYFNSVLLAYTDVNCRVISGRSKAVMAASDVVICASGTATLEVMLVNRPMVVCYRISGMTYNLMKWFKLLKTRFFSLPNILAGELLVPELLQQEVTGERIAGEVVRWLDNPSLRDTLKHRFDGLHRVLKINAAVTASNVVIAHIASRKA
jgi:lipid-A-disaccharide synthase